MDSDQDERVMWSRSFRSRKRVEELGENVFKFRNRIGTVNGKWRGGDEEGLDWIKCLGIGELIIGIN